jgi:hypothetical protein
LDSIPNSQTAWTTDRIKVATRRTRRPDATATTRVAARARFEPKKGRWTDSFSESSMTSSDVPAAPTFCKAGQGRTGPWTRLRHIQYALLTSGTYRHSADAVCSAPRANRFNPPTKPCRQARCLRFGSDHTNCDPRQRLWKLRPSDPLDCRGSICRGGRSPRSGNSPAAMSISRPLTLPMPSGRPRKLINELINRKGRSALNS